MNKSFKTNIFRLGPVLLLYFLSVTEIDTQYSNLFEILSFNLPLIVVYYWMLRAPLVIGNGHVFFAGVINDIITGLPLGTSSLSYLTVSFVASYIRSVSVEMTLPTDWFTFGIAVFFSNLINLILLNNFSDITILYTELFYNSLFTILFFPGFWIIFNIYSLMMPKVKND
jgi:cell shape-determining protein MreD